MITDIHDRLAAAATAAFDVRPTAAHHQAVSVDRPLGFRSLELPACSFKLATPSCRGYHHSRIPSIRYRPCIRQHTIFAWNRALAILQSADTSAPDISVLPVKLKLKKNYTETRTGLCFRLMKMKPLSKLRKSAQRSYVSFSFVLSRSHK